MQPEVLSEGDALLSAAPGRGDGVISTPSQSPSSHCSSRGQAGRRLAWSVDPRHRSALSSHTGCPSAWVRSTPLPLAKVLPGLLLLGIACTCPWTRW